MRYTKYIAWVCIAQNLNVVVQTLFKIVHKEGKMFKFCSKLKLLGLIEMTGTNCDRVDAFGPLWPAKSPKFVGRPF